MQEFSKMQKWTEGFVWLNSNVTQHAFQVHTETQAQGSITSQTFLSFSLIFPPLNDTATPPHPGLFRQHSPSVLHPEFSFATSRLWGRLRFHLGANWERLKQEEKLALNRRTLLLNINLKYSLEYLRNSEVTQKAVTGRRQHFKSLTTGFVFNAKAYLKVTLEIWENLLSLHIKD